MLLLARIFSSNASLPREKSYATWLLGFLIAFLFGVCVLPLSAGAQPFGSGTEIAGTAEDAAAVDLDQDGDTDILSAFTRDDTAAENDKAKWHRNGDAVSGDGDGSSWTTIEITAPEERASAVDAADIDGDGDPDVVSADEYNLKISWHRNGDATSGDGNGTSWTTFGIDDSNLGSEDIAVADLDGDGDPDVLRGAASSSLVWYRNGDATSGDGDGTSWTRIEITSTDSGAERIHPTDVDDDGDVDVLVAGDIFIQNDTQHKVLLYRNGDSSGNGDGSSWTKVEVASPDAAFDASPADVDGDGDLDVVSAGDRIAWYRNGDGSAGDGDGTSWSTEDVSKGGRLPSSVFTADVEADGDADVITSNSFGDEVFWYRNENTHSGTGDGSSWNEIAISTSVANVRRVIAFDADGDGDTDIFSAGSKIWMHENARVAGTDQIVFVDPDATGADDGSSWTDAYPTLQDALANLPSSAAEVWVAAGTYRPDEGAGQTAGDRSSTFTLPSGTSLYGGFDGTDGSGGGDRETEREQRNPDPATNGTVLTGDLGVQGSSADNAYRVVTVPKWAAAVMSGFTVRDGFADASEGGAGIRAREESNLVLRGVRILNNSSSAGNGGGIFGEVRATLSVEDATIADNSSTRSGGGIFAIARDNSFTNVVVRNNTSGKSGGGILGSGTYTNVTVRDNEAGTDGGGLFASGTFRDVTFQNNSAGEFGGGLYASSLASLDLADVTFVGNTAVGSGGGAHVRNALRAFNVAFYGNELTSSTGTGGGLRLEDTGGSLANVVFSGNESSGDGGALYLGPNSSPSLTNLTFSANSVSGEGGAVYVTDGSPSIRNTILWGNSSSSTGNQEQVYVGSSGQPSIASSLIENGVPQGVTDDGENLDQDPLFIDPDGPDGTAGTTDDDLLVEERSPAVDAGDNTVLPDDVLDVNANGNTSEGLPIDIAGAVRRQDVSGTSPDGSFVVDMGAYEVIGSPIPVEFASFNARRITASVILTWHTASEQDNAGFHIQRKTSDGSWTQIGFVDGAGTTSKPQAYRFVDDRLPHEADVLTYRLEQVDTDGTARHSKTVTARRSVEALQLLGVYPNPARHQATIQYAVPNKQPVTIRLYDVLGRQVRTVVDERQKGRVEETIRLNGLSSGVYFLRLRANGKTQMKKITVVR